VPSRERLFELVRAGFAHRRKMLRRTLPSVLGERTLSVLHEARIDPRTRPQELGLTEWASLARAEAAA
jgi:16S rRNA A1518/A1519 N6-dimethyltransferase RsmA/KsgA/DIM1 with predicted DNA glycosylase/AP lyase activity